MPPHCATPAFYLSLISYPPTTDIYTLSLHDALPISHEASGCQRRVRLQRQLRDRRWVGGEVTRQEADDLRDQRDRKSTRLNSSHRCISYAVFCLKKKKT